jgi:predicted  nucleic acid-binding Zn-ribbon protein
LEDKIVMLSGEIARLHQLVDNLKNEKSHLQARAGELEHNLAIMKIDIDARVRQAIVK